MQLGLVMSDGGPEAQRLSSVNKAEESVKRGSSALVPKGASTSAAHLAVASLAAAMEEWVSGVTERLLDL